MTDNVLTDIYNNMKSNLTENGFRVSEYSAIDYGIQFNIFISDWAGLLRVYQNKKGATKVDYSQLKNNDRVLEIQKLIEGTHLENIPQSSVIPSLGFPIIGTDESGKGDYFGPLVAAGVYVDENSASKLKALGIKDSKLLSDGRALELSQMILDICRGRYSIIEISPEKYNNLYEQFQKENKNLNTLLAWGHAKAIEEILDKVECKLAIADQFADKKFILSKLQEKGGNLTLTQVHKAEQHIAVAAASVLARARFLLKLKKLSEDIGINLPKGASQSVNTVAQRIVDERGKEALRQVAKLHFKITANIRM
ncbi:ribonuclease HIII [Chloroflexota bacterium]